MLNKPLANIVYADVADLVGNARESRVVEFKRELAGAEGDVKFLKGVSALANTAGGDFVIGIASNKDGVVDGADGIAFISVDKEVTRLSQMLTTNLEPRLPSFNIHPVVCPNGNHVLIVRVVRSWVGPHRLLRDNHFYARSPANTYPMDVGELRSSFAALDSGVERVRSFRSARLGKIQMGDTPIGRAGDGKVVIHVMPLPSGIEQQVDVVRATAPGTHMPLPPGDQNGGNQAVFNLDGVLSIGARRAGEAVRYAQLFRSGAIEGVSPLNIEDGIPYFATDQFANLVVRAIRQYIGVLRSVEIPFPVFAGVSFAGAPAYQMKYDLSGTGWQLAGPVRGPVIAIPEVAIQDANADVPAAVRPALDMIWNAFGFVACTMYQPDGTWRGH